MSDSHVLKKKGHTLDYTRTEMKMQKSDSVKNPNVKHFLETVVSIYGRQKRGTRESIKSHVQNTVEVLSWFGDFD